MYLPDSAPDLPGSPPSGEAARPAVLSILDLYEANERNIERLASNDIDAVLSDDTSTLPTATRQVLRGALLHAATAGALSKGEDDRPVDDPTEDLPDPTLDPAACDETLVRWKGLTESLSDLPSAAQAAQKIGQTFSLFVAGPAAPLAIKLVASAAHALLYGMGGAIDEPTRKAFVAAVSLSTGSISLAGSVVALAVAYTYHKNIKTKEDQRQRNEQRGSSMPNAGVGGSLKDLSARQVKPDNFNTLAATRIADSDLPRAIFYDATVTFWDDVLEQIRAPKLADLWSSMGIEPAVFDIRSPEQADRIIEEHTRRLLGPGTTPDRAASLTEVVVQGSPHESSGLIIESGSSRSSRSSSSSGSSGSSSSLINERGQDRHLVTDFGQANAPQDLGDFVDDSMVDRNEDKKLAAVYEQTYIDVVLDQLGIETSDWTRFVDLVPTVVWLDLGNLLRWMLSPDRDPAELNRWSPQVRKACRQLATQVSNDITSAFTDAERSAFRRFAKQLKTLESEASKGDMRSEASV
ncbi:MAG: hypothetical protein EOO22_08065 [Comamonadaceae bacterium]|nr:MAG: hypothetical protein EOO22_08065 [Comamonadaceae bacterium]